MNPQQARERVAETFPQPFNKTKFLEFTRNLLNEFDESKAAQWKPPYIKDAFKPHVSWFERLGTYTSPRHEKLDVLIVHLTNKSKLERARTAIRNFVADHLKTRDQKDAALVAFVSPTERQWRFSYVRMEYAAVATESGKVGVKTHLTPARRCSYIVGEGESCHTAQSRFLALLQNTENKPNLADLEEAFSVEAVTREFFNQYAALFEDINKELDRLVKKDKAIRDEFKARNVNPVEFAKKLMGQLVFLYFLQKKGWLGVAKGQDWGAGPHNFLRRLIDQSAPADKSDTVNIFNDILEPLFYDTLATDRGPAAWCKLFQCRIPFLNGGLFEPLGDYDWRRVDIRLPNKLFTNTTRTAAGDLGSGILDVFDRYNFTVNEAEPLEKEVAIDPEMLGKVFENLIEENRRKGLGSFYTPREIVHYMCQESLINYLDTAVNDRPDQSTPSAPRVPRADLETFVHLGDQISHYEAVETRYAIKMPRSIEQHARLIDEKLAGITVCDPAVGSGAFPVGMMTEIVRARCALNPYFDPSDTSAPSNAAERTPYHFKRHAIQNCLYGVDIDPGAVEIAKLRLWLSLVVDEEDVKQIKPLPNLSYKIVTGNSLLGVEKDLFNERLFRRLEELKPRFFDQSDPSKKSDLKREIDHLIHELTNGKEAFDFEIYFSEVFHQKSGFDVVIANPPYVRQEEIKEFKLLFQDLYDCYDGRADLYVYFYERSVKLLRAAGVLTLITSNKYHRAGYGNALRGFLPRELTLHRLIDFGDAPVFEAIAYASILSGTRNPPPKEASFVAYTWEQELSFECIRQTVADRGQEIPQSELKPDGWLLESAGVRRLLEKMRRCGKPLGEYVKGRIYAGIKTGLNEAFLLDSAMRAALIAEDPRSKELIKPFVKGKDADKWVCDGGSRFIIYTPHGVPINEYPAIKNHLAKFKAGLEKRALDQKWFELQQPQLAFTKDFEKTKIVYPNVAFGCRFSMDTGSYLDMTAFCICSDEFTLLGILNSSAMNFYFAHLGIQRRGGYQEFKTQYVKDLPIPKAPPEKQKAMECLVDRILTAKQRNPEADVSTLEREIDKLVYALYGLTPEEIKIVEGAAK